MSWACRGFGDMRTDYYPVVVDQLPHEQLRIFRRPDPDNDINYLFNQIHQPIR
jgi:hypothetical protein